MTIRAFENISNFHWTLLTSSKILITAEVPEVVNTIYRIYRSLEMWYLHAPDRTVPYEETLKAVNDLYKEGYFKRFGISNYMS